MIVNCIRYAVYATLCTVILMFVPFPGYAKNNVDTTPHYQRIIIQNEVHKNGIFDITVEYGDDAIGWMAYSRVEFPNFVETRLAKSLDRGKTWTYVNTPNPSTFGTLIKDGKTLHGAWRNETPTLLYDRSDRPDKRWKLFSQRAFCKSPCKPKGAMWEESWIEYRTAASPEGPWSDAIPLLSAKDGNAQFNLNGIHPDLRNIVFYAEPGSIELNGTIYLSLDASATASGLGKWKKRKIILIASKDHGKNWYYVGTLTDYNDANDFGYVVLTASSIAKEDNTIYALLSPAGKKGLFASKGHDGVIIVPFIDITLAQLQRDNKGRLLPVKQLFPVLHSGGEVDYHEQNTYGGLLFSQIDKHVTT